jgi:hypothetical protein
MDISLDSNLPPNASLNKPFFDSQYSNMTLINNHRDLEAALLLLQNTAHSFNTPVISPNEMQRRARTNILKIIAAVEHGLQGLTEFSRFGHPDIEGRYLYNSIRGNCYFVDHDAEEVVKRMVDVFRDIERGKVMDNCVEEMEE